MDAKEYKPRPDDDLVEPLYAGLRDPADPAAPESGPSVRGLWIVWLAGILAVMSLVVALVWYLA